MIVKNEEDVLEKCLKSVHDIIDEIIIVDTGSKDKTKKIAKKFTSKIYDFKWVDDFSAARNYSFAKANMDYILWLDADDVVLEEDILKLKELKQTIDPNTDIVMMKYNSAFDENGNVTLSYFRERLLKRSKGFKWNDPIHEYIEPSGRIITADICITHKKVHCNSDRNLTILEKLISEGKCLSPRNLFYYARELYYNKRFDDAIIYFNKFIDSEKGWIEDIISACYDLSICYNAKNDKQNMLKSLLKSFEYDTPRAEICCQIGYYYFDKNDYDKAIFWYELATKLKMPKDGWGFILYDCWGYQPCIQICVCHYRLGNIKEAIKYNDMAAEYKPNDSSVLYNKKLFEDLDGLKKI